MARRVKTFEMKGVQWYVDKHAIKFMWENDEYNMSARDIFECVGEDEIVYQYDDFYNDVELREEPDNKYDANAVGIYIKNIRAGFVKREDCTEVKRLLKDPTYKYATVQIQGGKYKVVRQNDDFEIKTKRGEDDFFGTLSLYFFDSDDDDPFMRAPKVPEAQPKKEIKKPKTLPKKEIKVGNVHLFVSIAAIAVGLIFSLFGMVGFGIFEIVVGTICVILWLKYHK